MLADVGRNNPLTGLDVAPGDRVLFVGAHPDDETYGAGATLAALARLGVSTHVVSLSSGEAAFDHVGVAVPDLGERRRAEFDAACGELGVVTSSVLDLPDGGLADVRLTSIALSTIARERRGRPSCSPSGGMTRIQTIGPRGLRRSDLANVGDFRYWLPDLGTALVSSRRSFKYEVRST